jgi:hypothetical protein
MVLYDKIPELEAIHKVHSARGQSVRVDSASMTVERLRIFKKYVATFLYSMAD